jgi:tetratricopeptide (TPR) repeat protein
MTDASRSSRSIYPVWLACLFLVLAGSGLAPAKTPEWLDELNRMEKQADQARKDFWCGRYEEAAQQFSALADSVHPSVMLYLNECAMCELAQGNYEGTEQRLRQVDSLLNTYSNTEREKKAMSAFEAEAEKIYRGDPYEQATTYLLLALIFLDRGDYDNALAACKSGILADSDAAENLFDSDVTLLHALEAKCYQLRGEEESFRSRREAAAKSVQLTSAQVREDFSRRQDLLELLKMSRKERRKVGEKRKDDEIQAEIQNLSGTLERNMASVDAMKLLGPLYSGQYNVLVLVPRGRCVEKTRTGADAEMVIFKQHEIPCEGPGLYLDEQALDPAGCLPTAVDLEFQAMTRGGRRMDAILRGKAASRATTRGVGQTITEIGNNVGGLGGLGVALIGAAVQGAAGSMTAEADTRCWQTLPKQFQIYALNLPLGDHEISGAQYLYFQERQSFQRPFTLADERDMAVVVVPPPAYELYFRHNELKLSKRDRAGMEDAATILIPPPTGLDAIVRVHIADSKAKLEAIAPDPKRIMRAIRKSLTAHQMPGALVTHAQVIQSRHTLATEHNRALQCHFVEIAKEGNRKTGTYRAKLMFSLIDAKTGRVLARQTTEGTSTDIKSGPTTAFYSCIQKAAEAFLQQTDFEGLPTASSI